MPLLLSQRDALKNKEHIKPNNNPYKSQVIRRDLKAIRDLNYFCVEHVWHSLVNLIVDNKYLISQSILRVIACLKYE